ncbi:MAG: hypothetical protein ACTSYC_11240 [Promethearchaeota archaeon]
MEPFNSITSISFSKRNYDKITIKGAIRKNESENRVFYEESDWISLMVKKKSRLVIIEPNKPPNWSMREFLFALFSAASINEMLLIVQQAVEK